MRSSTVTTSAASAGLVAAAALLVAAPAVAGDDVRRASGQVVRYPGQQPLADAPRGASARVRSTATTDGRTIVTLHLSGFETSAQYGAHAHVEACGDPAVDPTGLAAKGHFQHVPPSPPQTATSPEVANPQNEIWLDVTTDQSGTGRARAEVSWQFEPARRPKSVIIHEMPTLRTEGRHGVAGKRIACLDVPF